MTRDQISIRRFPATRHGLIAAVVLGALALAGAPYATGVHAAHQAAATISVGSKQFAEEYLISDMYQQLLQKAGFNVSVHRLGETPILTNAIKRGDIDLYPEYTGTGLQVLGISRIVTNASQAYNIVKTQYKRRYNLIWLQQSPFNDTNGIAVTAATSSKYGLHTLSDLAKVAGKLSFAGLPACKDRPDCLAGLQKVYGIKFKSTRFLTSQPLIYKALTSGQADVIEVFTTDGPIRADHLVVLKDNKAGVFPADHVAPIVRNSTLSKYPKIRSVLNRLAPYLTTTAMIRLNQQVVLQTLDDHKVARQFLKSKGLL